MARRGTAAGLLSTLRARGGRQLSSPSRARSSWVDPIRGLLRWARSALRPCEPPGRTSSTIGGNRGSAADVLRVHGGAKSLRTVRVRRGDLQGVGCCGWEDSPLGAPRRTPYRLRSSSLESGTCGPPGRASTKRLSSVQDPGPKPSKIGRRYDGRFNPQALKDRPDRVRTPQPLRPTRSGGR